MRAVATLVVMAGVVIGGVVIGGVVSPNASAQAQGPAVAGPCAVCHGPKGIANAPETPHLAGQPQGYLVAQLKAFRDGTRKHEVMAVIAKGLSDADIDALSRWYASIAVDAK